MFYESVLEFLFTRVQPSTPIIFCIEDHILQEFNIKFLTRFRTYKIATPYQTKMTSKYDI